MGALNTLPLSYKVEGQRIVIVGGGEEALNKARLATKTTALVVIIAPTIAPELRALDVEIVERPFDASDVDDAALVFVACEGEDAETAIAAARTRGIPLNVVDKPALCDFYVPSIVDRAPLTVAVSSEGDFPVLARLVRARIEAMLSPRLGTVARIGGRLRERVARAFLRGEDRRKFYERLAVSAEVEDAAGRNEAEAERAALALLADPEAPRGFVHLVGAGPGSEDLLTLRAQRVLQAADVIVHDQLVPTAVVDMGRKDARRIDVGKTKGSHSISQHQINHLLVSLAREGKTVVRLKSGDPLIFGRAGEELAALRRENVPHAIVPGISAAMAAAADTATPVTLRRVASGFALATAHGADDTEVRHWVELAQGGMTLGIYMGKSVAADVGRKLIAGGLLATTPVGIVVNAGRADRALSFGTLGALAAAQPVFGPGPGIILIGEAVVSGDWSGARDFAEQLVDVA